MHASTYLPKAKFYDDDHWKQNYYLTSKGIKIHHHSVDMQLNNFFHRHAKPSDKLNCFKKKAKGSTIFAK